MKVQISLGVIMERLICTIVLATGIVQFVYLLNTKFQASTYNRLLHSPVCVRPGWKPQWCSHQVTPLCISRSPAKQQEEEEEVDIDLEDPEVEQAALKIQAGFKGFKARQEIKELKVSGCSVKVIASLLCAVSRLLKRVCNIICFSGYISFDVSIFDQVQDVEIIICLSEVLI